MAITEKTSRGEELATLMGRLDDFIRNFSSSPVDPPEKISALKAELRDIQLQLARFDDVPEHFLTLSWRKLFETQHWRGIHPEGLNPLIEEVRVHWLRAKSLCGSGGENSADVPVRESPNGTRR